MKTAKCLNCLCGCLEWRYCQGCDSWLCEGCWREHNEDAPDHTLARIEWKYEND